ncbi:MAG: isocitrate dehydrogenase [Candidatus Altiarchaeales archaeon ex4484_43]|nr:MAG: isocitrate dehydrogenase [Candidatus Altiarchaeales archaeon ex4484_43]
MRKVTLIPGDGIGPEVIDSCVRVIEATGIGIEFERVDAGAKVMEREGTPLPDSVLDSIRRNKVALKGPITTPIASGFRSVNVALRKALDLYVNLRPVRSFKGIESRYEYARREKRKKVTAVHKANIMKITDGIFLESARRISKEFPEIEFEDRIVDNMCMQLVRRPELYDVLLAPNLFGDIISDLCAGLVGGLGIAPSANIGDKIAMFEPVHGSAPKYAGLDKVNPTATILAGVLMLKHLGEKKAADSIEGAITESFKEGKKLTYDLGGDAKTSEFTDYVISKIL